jgi:hypothetical protein
MFLNQNKYYSQPNIDAGREVSPELYGTLTPGYVADQAAMYAANESWQHDVAPRLKDIYAPHIGVAHRVVQSLLRETRSA